MPEPQPVSFGGCVSRKSPPMTGNHPTTPPFTDSDVELGTLLAQLTRAKKLYAGVRGFRLAAALTEKYDPLTQKISGWDELITESEEDSMIAMIRYAQEIRSLSCQFKRCERKIEIESYRQMREDSEKASQ